LIYSCLARLRWRFGAVNPQIDYWAVHADPIQPHSSHKEKPTGGKNGGNLRVLFAKKPTGGKTRPPCLGGFNGRQVSSQAHKVACVEVEHQARSSRSPEMVMVLSVPRPVLPQSSRLLNAAAGLRRAK
jgi:hypothetical protein